MRLYHHPMSACSRRALMTAVHLGIDLDLEVVDLRSGAQRRPEHLARNPNGKVPVLEDEGFLLWESHAIMQYLADKSPGQTVFPTEPRARADVSRWLFWSANHFAPAAATLGHENFVKVFMGRGSPDPSIVARAEEVFREHASVLDRHLEGRSWIVEDALTLADLAIAAPLMAIERARLPVAACKNVLRWFARVQSLEAWKKTRG